jgi:hypothetical protein
MLQDLPQRVIQVLEGRAHLQKRAVQLSGSERLALIGVAGGFLARSNKQWYMHTGQKSDSKRGIIDRGFKKTKTAIC